MENMEYEVITENESESLIQKRIRLALSEYGIVFRVNVGKVKMHDGRWFSTRIT